MMVHLRWHERVNARALKVTHFITADT
jgi:hypothetical protein